MLTAASATRFVSQLPIQPPARICFRIGSRWSRRRSGSSDIGKWPTPPISWNVEPAIASWAWRPSSTVPD